MPVVNPNPNMFRQLDYGAAVQSGQQIRYNQLKNQALGMEQQEQQNILKARKRADEIRSQIDSMPDQIKALDDAGLFEQADKLRDTYIRTRKSEVEIIDAMREGINETNYDQVKQGMLEEGNIVPGLWPEKYSDDWFREQADQKRGALSKFTRKQLENGAIMSQDIVQQDGEIVWSGTPYEAESDRPGGKGGAGGFEFKAADTNAIARQVERAYDVVYDPATGEFTGLDKAITPKLIQLQEEAERIYSEGQGAVSHGVALAQAARKLRIPVPDVRDTMATDPFQIRQPAP